MREENFPKYFQEFLYQFKDEESCCNYIFELRWWVVVLVKRRINGTHQGKVSPKYLPYYLDEFAFRFNRKMSTFRGKLFYRLIQQTVEQEPIYFNGIVKLST